MIDLNFTPKTFVFILAAGLVAAWAFTYIAAFVSQVLFIVLAILVLVVVYAVAIRLWRRLTGQSRPSSSGGGGGRR